jgi:hypothetical protein
MSDLNTEGRKANAAQPLGERDGLETEKSTKRTGERERNSAERHGGSFHLTLPVGNSAEFRWPPRRLGRVSLSHQVPFGALPSIVRRGPRFRNDRVRD